MKARALDLANVLMHSDQIDKETAQEAAQLLWLLVKELDFWERGLNPKHIGSDFNDEVIK